MKKDQVETVADLLKVPVRRGRNADRGPAPARTRPKRAGSAPQRQKGRRQYEGTGKRSDALYAPRIGPARRLLLERMEMGVWYTSRELVDLCAPDLTMSGVWTSIDYELKAGRLRKGKLAKPVRVIGLMRRYNFKKVADHPPESKLRDRYIARYGEEAWIERERLRHLAHCKDWQRRNPERMRVLRARYWARRRES